MSSKSSGDASGVRLREDPLHLIADTAAPNSHLSPLTFGKVYLALPRVTGVNTPNINAKIAKPWGLPSVPNAAEFKKIYVDGRATLRYFIYFFELCCSCTISSFW